jgi:hypothetical protein
MPASNPQAAQEKWERKTDGDKWRKGIQSPSRSVSAGLAEFWGGSEDQYSQLQQTYNEEIAAAIDDNSYESGVEGKGDLWRRKAKAGAQNG